METYLLVAGSRDYTDKETFNKVMDCFIQENIPGGDVYICQGGATGADRMALEYACRHEWECLEFEADWEKYGRAAGPKRNDKMTKYVKDHGGMALFFWDGKSKGTKNCIESARKHGLPVRIWNTAEGRYMDE